MEAMMTVTLGLKPTPSNGKVNPIFIWQLGKGSQSFVLQGEGFSVPVGAKTKTS
jgi:hypothetical protein